MLSRRDRGVRRTGWGRDSSAPCRGRGRERRRAGRSLSTGCARLGGASSCSTRGYTPLPPLGAGEVCGESVPVACSRSLAAPPATIVRPSGGEGRSWRRGCAGPCAKVAQRCVVSATVGGWAWVLAEQAPVRGAWACASGAEHIGRMPMPLGFAGQGKKGARGGGGDRCPRVAHDSAEPRRAPPVATPRCPRWGQGRWGFVASGVC